MSASKKKNNKKNLTENDSQNVKEDYGLKSENKVKVDVKGSQNITSKNEMFIPKHIIEKHQNEKEDLDEGLEVVIGVGNRPKENEIPQKEENQEESNAKEVKDKEQKKSNTSKKESKQNNELKEVKLEEKNEKVEEDAKEEITLEVFSDNQILEEEIIELPDDIEDKVEVQDSLEKIEEKVEEPKVKKELVTQKDKSILKDDKPDYVKEMIANKKARMKKFIIIAVSAIVIILFSTIFAIFNISKTTFLKGVTLNGVDLSGKTMDDARIEISEIIKTELIPELIYKHGDYEVTILPEQIEFKYDLEESLQNAYNVGRSGNIVQNNYAIIFNSLFGKNVDMNYTYNEELLNNIVEDINSKMPGVVVEPSYYIEEANLIISKGKDGESVRKSELKSDIIYQIVSRDHLVIKEGKYDGRRMLPVSNVKAQEIDIDKIYEEVYRLPQDAYFETDPYQIYPDKDGIDFAISKEEAKDLIKENKEEYIIPLKITKAEKTLNDLGTEAFPYQVSEFTTKYDASNKNRSTNLRIAAEKINGLVLMPGEEFSFNRTVGKRTVEEGYKDAKIYADGGVVDGLAGGICQISSTLYNAALLANLEIVERRNHTFTTSYVPAGKDATVVYGVTDFRFKNTRQYPIKLEASVQNGIAEFKIHGMQEENEYEIRILPVRTASIPYSTTYEEDPSLMPGQEKVVQAGHAGYKVTTYKEVRLNGQIVSKDVISSDTYSPMRTIKKVAPGMVPPAQ